MSRRLRRKIFSSSIKTEDVCRAALDEAMPSNQGSARKGQW